ncbi:MAG TPA: carbon starvation CstA family protein [Syntrophorhabdaceae bacterium]|nr:carbon starvation CstA family protein [Syntrophorhabdaceae bacterium]HOT42188.1 carbon starvation CstA family protein [Syntrophorhabdaceae bacterium]HPC66857.1 carbon starvation CstA family protein [Syntrophorhabdaceae bacterium]HQE79327.1 carbon starvation CstA family protein [Syntrophorhabdaceae bacterium]HQH42980.1 carbon starvation CstA family protein [Syntrophorhabdaceae bacterium]
MNSVVVLILGFIVAFIGYRVYAKYVDTKIMKADPKKVTPAKMYMDGVEFMPTSKNILFGYQFKSIAGAAPVIGPIIAIQWGWLPALIWILAGTFFIGWVQDYSSAMIAMRHEGASLGGLSHKLISPRARFILLAFLYFYLLLIAGAFGNVVVSTAIGLKAAPMAWLFLTIGGVLAGQMIYRWRKDIILTTVITVIIALFGIWLGSVVPSNVVIGDAMANSRWLWTIFAFLFCYFAAVLPIWRFALPINYVASYIVFLGLFFGIIGIFILHPNFTLPAYTGFTIKIGPIWPIMFVTIACGAISGWHSLVSSSGTARQLENELDARPVGGGVMFVEMMLAVFALIIAGTIYASSAEYGAAIVKGPGGVFAAGVSKFLGALGLPAATGRAYGSVMMIVLAITIMQLVIRFMRIATSELLSDISPIFRNAHVGTIIASLLGMLLVLTGWWQYLWVLFGGANQLMASLALMLVTAYLMSEGKPAAYAFYPMIFMFITTIAALLYTSYNLLNKVMSGAVKGEALVGNALMGIVGIFLVIAALVLAAEGIKAFNRYRSMRAQAAPAKA